MRTCPWANEANSGLTQPTILAAATANAAHLAFQELSARLLTSGPVLKLNFLLLCALAVPVGCASPIHLLILLGHRQHARGRHRGILRGFFGRCFALLPFGEALRGRINLLDGGKLVVQRAAPPPTALPGAFQKPRLRLLAVALP